MENDLLKRDIRDFFGGKVFSQLKLGEKILVILIGATGALKALFVMVPPLRLELKTLDLADRSSIQLNYGGTKKGGDRDLATSLPPPSSSSFTHRSAKEHNDTVF